MSKFKVGDKIKCIKDLFGEGAPKNGETFIVKSVSGSHVGIECPNLSSTYINETKNGLSPNWGQDWFELVKKVNKTKFKVGDKVRVLKSDYCSDESAYKAGDIVTVIEVEYENNRIRTINKAGYQNGWGFDKFELVEDQPLTNEELLQKLNEGMDSREELFKRNVKLEAFRRQAVWGSFDQNNYCIRKYRLAVKKEFQPFETSNGWKVSVRGEFLQIGCKAFPLNLSKEILITFTTNFFNKYITSDHEIFFANRKGISHSDHILNWEDADKILNALNEMEK